MTDSDGYDVGGRTVPREHLAHLGVGVLAGVLVLATGSLQAPNALVTALGAVFLASLFATFSWATWNIVLPTMVRNSSV